MVKVKLEIVQIGHYYLIQQKHTSIYSSPTLLNQLYSYVYRQYIQKVSITLVNIIKNNDSKTDGKNNHNGWVNRHLSELCSNIFKLGI